MRLGRNRPTAANPHPHFSAYRTGAPQFPNAVDYQAAAMPNLQQVFANAPDPTFPIAPLGLGDCTIAACAHAEGVWRMNARGLNPNITTDQVVTAYSACGGYIRGNDATDQGCDELVVLNYWKTNGIAGHQIDGAVTINAADPSEVCLAIWLFGLVIFCAELPWLWTPVPGAGFLWDVAGAAVPSRGHCWIAPAYDSTGPVPITWGLASDTTPSHQTWNATATYCVPGAGGACFAPISRDWLNAQGIAPNGFNLDQLVADASAIGVIS